MKRRCTLALAAAVAASCGGDSGPSTTPPPPPRAAPLIPLAWANLPSHLSLRAGDTHNIRLNLTTTVSARFQVEVDHSRVSVSRALLNGGVFTAILRGQSVGHDTVHLTATAPGYQAAQASFSVTVAPGRPPPPPPTVDPLFNDRRFQRSFWRQLVFDGHECPRAGSCKGGTFYYPSLEDRVVAVLSGTSPGFYIRTHDDAGHRTFTSSQIATMRRVIPRAVEALTGVRFRGEILWSPQDFSAHGWITITRESLGEEVCGRAWVGASPGVIELDTSKGCSLGPLLAHEVGHAMGFFHVPNSTDVMYPSIGTRSSFSSREVFHARVAYQLGRGHPYADGRLIATEESGPDDFERGDPPVVVCRPRS